MKRGVKAELCLPLMSVKEDMEREKSTGFVYTGDYLISMSSLRGASKGSCHSTATSKPLKVKYSFTEITQEMRRT